MVGAAHPQISRSKLLRMALKPRNPRKFSPSKVSRYTVLVITFTLALWNLSQWSLPCVLCTLYEVVFA